MAIKINNNTVIDNNRQFIGTGLDISGNSTSTLVTLTQAGTGDVLRIEDSSRPDSTPFIIDASGNVGVGTASPNSKLEVNGSASFIDASFTGTSAVKLPVGLEIDRPLTPNVGQIRFNTDIGKFEGYNGESWLLIGDIIAQQSEMKLGVETKTRLMSPLNIKQAIDALSLPVGTIITTGLKTPPDRFLPCDGRQISKETYPELYAEVQDTFSPLRNVYINGNPEYEQWTFNNQNNTFNDFWTIAENLEGQPTTGFISPGRCGGALFVTKNKVYYTGGFNNAGRTTVDNITQYADINPDGTISRWNNALNPLGTAKADFSACVKTKNRVYLIGGGIPATNALTYTATIDENGTLGSWARPPNNNTTLDLLVKESASCIVRNKLYILGGWTSATVATVWKYDINDDGTLSAFTTTGIPAMTGFPRRLGCAFSTQNYIYYIGGLSGAANTETDTILRIQVDGAGNMVGTWQNVGTIPAKISAFQLIVTRNRIFLLGGFIPVNGFNSNATAIYNSNIFYANINADESIGSWSAISNKMSPGRAHTKVFTTNSKTFMIGGIESTTSFPFNIGVAFNGGSNDYITPNYLGGDYNTYITTAPYISSTPESDKFYIPRILPASQTNYGSNYPTLYQHILAQM